MVSAREALARLRAGNLRFAASVRGGDSALSQGRPTELPAGRKPVPTLTFPPLFAIQAMRSI